MWPPVFAALLALWIVFGPGGTAIAADFASLGYREDTVIVGDGRDECIGTLIYNHDFSFENGYCWQYEGVAPPYFGAFAEGYDLGPGTAECAVYWLTTLGWYPDPMDVYLWDGGVHGPPGGVLCVVPGVTGLNIPYWPSCGLNEIEISCCMGGDFAVGYWTDSSNHGCTFYCCVDENGTAGHPWTCIAPGIGYPSGWQHPNVVYPDCVSMGIGVTVTDNPSPAESETWGAIKSLYQR
jgi:hypothetical protein